MAKFIPIEKMKALREASKSGDERAKKILSMQLGGKEDFSGLLDEYFTPQPAVTEQPATSGSGLEQFLQFNGINKDSPDYQSYVDDYYKENPNEPHEECHECECIELMKKLMKEESDAIESYSKAITQTMNSEELDDGQKRKIISRLKEIRSDEEEHFSELKELLSVCGNKEEEMVE